MSQNMIILKFRKKNRRVNNLFMFRGLKFWNLIIARIYNQ